MRSKIVELSLREIKIVSGGEKETYNVIGYFSDSGPGIIGAGIVTVLYMLYAYIRLP